MTLLILVAGLLAALGILRSDRHDGTALVGLGVLLLAMFVALDARGLT